MNWQTTFSLQPHLFATQQLGFQSDPVQHQFLRHHHRQTLLNCTRQWGKSTLTAIFATDRLLYGPAGNQTLILAPSLRQSGELLLKIQECLRTLDLPARGDGHNDRSLRMPNGSRVIALPGAGGTTRTFSADLLIIDEASRIHDDLYHSLRPTTMARQGAIIALSMPAGPTGFSWDAWEHGGGEWTQFRVPAPLCARFSESALARERKALGEWWYRQEFLCEFVTSGSGFFPQAKLETMFEDVEPL